MKTLRTLIAGLALVIAVANVSAQEQSGPEIEWIDLSKAFELAPRTGKIVLIDFYTDWCGWCKRMDKTTYADSSVIAYIGERYHASRVNPEKEGEIRLNDDTFSPRQFAQGMNVRGYPTTCLVIMDEDNEKPLAIPLRAGYIPAQQLLMYLRYYGEDAYKSMTFEEFVGNGQSSTEPGTSTN